MDTSGTAPAPRQLTSQEIATCIRQFREIRRWSQEQLAEISGLNVRTIQRVEQGEPASFDTKRALARAFDLDDIDALNKPFSIPDTEELKAATEKFNRENITVVLSVLTSGRKLANLAERSDLFFAEPAYELPRDSAGLFASLVDYFREYGDCWELYSEVQKLDVYEEMQRFIDELRAGAVSLCFAERRLLMKSGTSDNGDKAMSFAALYVVAFPIGEEPDQIAIPRSATLAW